jgi:hypothetical protein
VSTLKFADRAKSVLTKVRPNEIVAYDADVINKLTKEINSLKEILSIRKKRGTFGEIEDQFTKLKEENERLKNYVMANMTDENIEKLLSENKYLKLELQKLKSKKTESSTDGDIDNDYSNYNSIKTERKNLIQNFNPGSNKLIGVGSEIVYNSNNINNISLNKSYNQNVLAEMKELKAANRRLKLLEDMEKKNGIKLKLEMEKIHLEKMKKQEILFNKNLERKKDIERIDGHIKRLNYLYKNNSNVYSDYLIQSTVVKKKQTYRGSSVNDLDYKNYIKNYK